MSKKSSRLRHAVDDSFVGGGHQIVQARQYKKIVPAWVNDNAEIRKIVIRSFPKWDSNDKQRIRAARWVRIIQLYFRAGYTRTQVAEEMSLTSEQVKSIIRGIRRVSGGKRADGSGNLRGHPGRPKLMPQNRG